MHSFITTEKCELYDNMIQNIAFYIKYIGLHDNLFAGKHSQFRCPYTRFFFFIFYFKMRYGIGLKRHKLFQSTTNIIESHIPIINTPLKIRTDAIMMIDLTTYM